MTQSTPETVPEPSKQKPVHGELENGVPTAAEHEHGHDAHGHGQYPFLQHHFDTPQQQFDAGKLGIWLFLVTEVLFFAGLFCAYTIYRTQHPEIFNYAHYHLDTNLGAINTTVLILSSMTAAWAVRNAQLGQRKHLIANIVITIGCAFTFMGVKYFEYSHKAHDGLLWGKHFNPVHEIWELDSFRSKHPEAAELAEKLAAVGKEGALPAQVPAPSDTVAPAKEVRPPVPDLQQASEDQPAANPATGTPEEGAAADAAPAAETAKTPAEQPAQTPEQQAETAAAGEQVPRVDPDTAAALTEATTGADQPETLAPQTPAAPPAATPAQAAEPPSAAARMRELISAAPRAALKPLIDAGLINAQTLATTTIERPKNVHIFFGVYFFMTGLHGIHVLAGIIVWIWMLVRATRGVFGADYFGPIDYAALYWHLVDLVWIYLFPLLYLIH